MSAHAQCDIGTALAGCRFAFEDEKTLQADIAIQLKALGVKAWREVPIAGGGIIDFMLDDGTGIEVKIKGRQAEILRQLAHYAADPKITRLIVAASIPLRLPQTLAGKPVHHIDLARAWL